MPARERFLGTALALMLGFVMVTGALVFVPGGAAALPADAWITGVVDDGSDPIPYVYVKVMMFMSGSIDVGYAFTDVNGEYTIGVPGGFEYMVLGAHGDYYMGMTSTRVDAGETAFANMTLSPIAPVVADVVIKGYVVDEFGVPAVDGHVLGISFDEMSGDMPSYANVTTPQPVTGYFQVNVLPSTVGGGAVAFDNEGYTMVDNSSESPLVGGQTYWFNITLRSNAEFDDAHIYGQVTDAVSGLPIEGVLVSVSVHNNYYEGDYSNYTFTDSSGDYEMDIMNGTARIMIYKGGYSMVMYDNEEIPSGASLQFDASLIALDCVVRGNVTDAKTSVPIEMAQVFVTDLYGNMVMTSTDDTGYYELESFSGDDLYLVAQSDGYVQNFTSVSLSPGDELWYDFGLHALSAWIAGTVTDITTGSPVEGAWVWAESDTFSNGDNTDSTGYYNISVAPGDYSVGVNAMDYRWAGAEVSVLDETTTTQDFELIPQNLGETVPVSGQVTDIDTTDPITNARVRVAIPDLSYWNETYTNETGSYGIYVVPLDGMPMSVTAYGYAPLLTTIDCASVTELVVDVQLERDYLQPWLDLYMYPRENVSWTNPMMVDLEAFDANMRDISLYYLMPWYSTPGFDHTYMFAGGSVSFDPFTPNSGLDYTQVGDVYFVHDEFDGTIDDEAMVGGWIDNGTAMSYLPAYKQWWGPDMMYAVRAQYTNDTLSDMPGAAFFDPDTGEYLFFRFDWGYDEATPEDTSGMVEFVVQEISLNQTFPNQWMWEGQTELCEAGVTDLSFVTDPVVPSGDYAALSFASDFGDQWNQSVVRFSVDNEVPVADAGGDRTVVVDLVCTLDASDSSDNVGIVEYMWEFDDGGVVTLYGETVDYTFTVLGPYDVTLTVEDGAGHVSVDDVVITVSVDMPPTADAGEDQTVDEDTLVTFDGSGSHDDVGIVDYTWTIPDLSEELYGVSPTFTFETPGVYDVELVVTDTNNVSSDPDTMVVTVVDTTAPVADAGEDQADVPYGDEVLLNGSLSSDNFAVDSWTWTFDDDGPVELDGETAAYTFSAPGEYNITLNVSDPGGNWDLDWVTVTVVDEVPPVADAGEDPEGVVAGDTVTLDGSGSSDDYLIVDWIWTFTDNGDVELDGEVVTYTFMAEGVYEVNLTVVDDSGNSDWDIVTVTVAAFDDEPVADAGDDIDDVVEGDTVTFDGGDSSDDVVTWTWTFTYDGEEQTLTGEVVTFVFEIPGTYIVTLNVTDEAGQSDTDTLVVVVSENASTFLTDYWWVLAAVAALAIIGALVFVMMRHKGGSGKDSDEGEEFEEDLPPPDDEDA